METPSDTGGDEPVRAEVSGTIEFSFGITSVIRTRTSLKVLHLLTAASMARRSLEIDRASVGQEFGASWNDLFGTCVGCVMLAQASLEACANELFADRAKHFGSRPASLVDVIWAEWERKSSLDKFDLAMRLRIDRPLDRGSTAAQAVDRLTQLRNGLVHFHPEWEDEQVWSANLSKRLQGYLKPSVWHPTRPLFPYGWATGSAASWAVRSVLEFVDEFSKATGLENTFDLFRDAIMADL